jgi:diketogulonate reductase-like aldo/keto reductase
MIYKRIGCSSVSSIGLGTFGIKDMPWILFKMAFANEIKFIDTSENYNTEEMIGNIVKKNERDDIFIATKVTPEHLSYDDVIKSAEGSLKRLRTDYIDLYQVHWPNPSINIEETMSAMNKLLSDGKIKHVGVSNFSLRQLCEARKFCDVESIQNEYNLFDRTAESDILPYCNNAHIAFVAYKPLDTGRKSILQEIILLNMSIRYQKSIVSIILRWLISHNSVIAIPKTSNVSHLRENADIDFKLKDSDIKILDDAFKTNVIEIPIKCIKSDDKGLEKFSPNPEVLAQSIDNGEELKPIRVKKYGDGYYLTGGKVRYWAYMLAKRDKIKAIIR